MADEEAWTRSLFTSMSKAKSDMLAASKVVSGESSSSRKRKAESTTAQQSSGTLAGAAASASAVGGGSSASAAAIAQANASTKKAAAEALAADAAAKGQTARKGFMTSRATEAEAQKQAQLSADLYKVLEHLIKVGVEHPQTAEQIETACELRVKSNPDLMQAMNNHINITFENNMWSYKPKHNIRSKEQLRQFIKSFHYKEAVPRKELQHTFSGFDQALKELKDSGEVLEFTFSKEKDKMLFFNDTSMTTTVDPELMQMWRKVEVPHHDDAVIKELQDNKQKVFTIIRAELDQAQKDEKRKMAYSKRRTVYNKTKFVNTHLTGEVGLDIFGNGGNSNSNDPGESTGNSTSTTSKKRKAND